MTRDLTLEAQPPPQADLQLLLLESECAADACIAAGETPGGDETLDFIAAGGTTYYFAVDGRLGGDDAPFELSVACREYGNCDLEDPIACGELVDDNVDEEFDAVDAFSLYAGAEHPKPGSETIFPFTPAESGTATVKLSSGSSGNLDLVVLEGACSSAEAVAVAETTFSSEDLSFDVVGGETYYLVVDGQKFEEGFNDAFSVEVSCEASCTSDEACGAPEPLCDEETGDCVACLEDGHCAPDELCSQARTCEPDPEACHGAGDCGAGEVCAEATAACEADCEAPGANPCPDGEVCDQASGLCVPAAPRGGDIGEADATTSDTGGPEDTGSATDGGASAGPDSVDGGGSDATAPSGSGGGCTSGPTSGEVPSTLAWAWLLLAWAWLRRGARILA